MQFLLRQPPSGHVITADTDGDLVSWDAASGEWKTGPPNAVKPDGGFLRLLAGGEPSAVTFTSPNTFKIGTASPGFAAEVDTALWQLPDATVGSLTYIGTQPRAYLMLAAIGLVAADTTVAVLASAGIDKNDDLAALLPEDAQNLGSMPFSVESNRPAWVHSWRYLLVENGDVISLAFATVGAATRTSLGCYLQFIEIKNVFPT